VFKYLGVQYTNVKYFDYLLKLEREARQNCKGLWQAYCEGPPAFSAEEIEEKMDQYLGEVVTVRYHVIGTYDSGDITFLNSSNTMRLTLPPSFSKTTKVLHQERY